MKDGLILAFQFLSRIPVPGKVSFDNKTIKASFVFFPLVGLFLGSVSGGVYRLFFQYNESIAAISAAVLMIVLTGGLHLDGLSDTFDGFLSGRDREKTLEIMKDSRVGTFGVLSLIIAVMIKFIVISSLEGLWIAIPLSMANARLNAVYLIYSKPSVSSNGLGAMFRESKPGLSSLVSGLIYIIIVIFIEPYYLFPILGTFLAGEAINSWSNKKIGGLTGDVYGAAIEIGEIASLIIFLGVLVWI